MAPADSDLAVDVHADQEDESGSGVQYGPLQNKTKPIVSSDKLEKIPPARTARRQSHQATTKTLRQQSQQSTTQKSKTRKPRKKMRMINSVVQTEELSVAKMLEK